MATILKIFFEFLLLNGKANWHETCLVLRWAIVSFWPLFFRVQKHQENVREIYFYSRSGKLYFSLMKLGCFVPENVTLSQVVWWHYVLVIKCYVTCGHLFIWLTHRIIEISYDKFHLIVQRCSNFETSLDTKSCISFYTRHTIVAGYYGFKLDICVSVPSVCRMSICPSIRISFWMITWVTINWFSANLVCALILWRSGLGLLMDKFHQILTELSARDRLIFSFPDDNLSKFQGIVPKFGTCIDIKDLWFGIADGQTSSIFDRVNCLQYDNGGVLSFYVFIFISCIFVLLTEAVKWDNYNLLVFS